MAPKKTVSAKSIATKTPRKNLIAKKKHGSHNRTLWARSKAAPKNGTHCKTILCLLRSISNSFLEGWAKGSAQAALAGKRFDFKTDPFTLLVMKILKEQNPTTFRSIRVQKDAICALQDSAESFLIKVLAGAGKLAGHAGRETVCVNDFELLYDLAKFKAALDKA